MVFPPRVDTGGGAIVIADDHIFADTTARDAYFVTNPSELVDNLPVYITGTETLQQYKLATTSWIDISPTIKGETGATGPIGPTGATGTDGKTWLHGEGSPASGLGVDGDFYLNTLTEWYYIKISGAWVEQECLIGSGGGGAGTWGTITGDIATQLDLIEALDAKVPETRTINSYALTSNITLPIPDELADLTDDSSHRVVTDTQIVTWDAKQDALGYTPENLANKGVANGYVPLGTDSKIDSSYIGQVSVTAVFPTTVEPLEPEDGWVWVNTDTGVSSIFATSSSSWYELGNSSGYVTSVNGHSGPVVSVTKSDVGLGNVVNVNSTVASNILTGTLFATVLPIATESVVGVVKPGTNVTVEADGTLNFPTVTSLTWGNVTGSISNQEDLQDALDAKAAIAHNHDGSYQAVDLDLTAIAALTGTTGVLKKTALNTWALDTNTFATVGALATKSDTTHNHTGTYQPVDADLTAIAALTGSGYLKRNVGDTWELGEGGSGNSGSFATYGIATITTGTLTTQVTHGYGAAPVIFEVLPNCTISDVNATTFTISVGSAVAVNTDFSWVIYGAENMTIDGGTFS
ncbi:MAG: hypothetical protein WC877_00125 [Dehalococcoidales bacterium]|jgi:hypothetical protein